jgi:hypothetical protein
MAALDAAAYCGCAGAPAQPAITSIAPTTKNRLSVVIYIGGERECPLTDRLTNKNKTAQGLAEFRRASLLGVVHP